ncbi:interleukin-17 receptor C [Esox lucius]|uniref:SEFIR domain-containing protein n=1 Tax=Esox lucius TaxID=8010 RepID=A0A3P8YQY4_ESOLU|nr:interleukin-17 receptor C [Esox lucius]
MKRCVNGPSCSVLLLCLLLLLRAADEITLTVKEVIHQNESVPQMELSTVRSSPSQGSCSVCVRLFVRMRREDFNGTLKITYLKLSTNTLRKIFITKSKGVKNDTLQWKENKQRSKTIQIKRLYRVGIGQQILWELVLNCFPGEAGGEVAVFLSSIPLREVYVVQNICPDPVPMFNLSVDELARSLTVTITTGNPINQPAPSLDVDTRVCYRQGGLACSGIFPLTTIDTNKSPSVNLTFPYLLPCVCVQVYYTHVDAKRTTVCPFVNSSLDAENRDVWLSGTVTLYGELGSSLAWASPCPPSDLKPSASLCWNDTTHCTPIFNTTLEDTVEKGVLRYNVSAVDRHPQMCVWFSYQGSHDVQCPFLSDMSKWEAHVGPGLKRLIVYLTSTIPASFAAQLCVQEKKGCVSRGAIYFVNMGGRGRETQLDLPISVLADGLCVQVWRSDVFQFGRRLLCPDYSHRRWGLYAVTAMALLLSAAMLGSLLYHVTMKGVTGWLSIQRPVLLVCSSGHTAHVSAVCSLASILQGELGAEVRMALWAQSSNGANPGTLDSSRTGVSELGPLPWLYGQWEAVREAGGRVLIIWSPEAKESYRIWREEREVRKTGWGTGDEMRQEESGEDWEGHEERRGKKERTGMKREEVWKDDAWEPTSVTGPVFRAALSCLQGSLQGGGRDHNFALVYFQGLGHSRDIPKDLRSVPRYCLPCDFGGLIRELGGLARGGNTGDDSWHCWSRLFSKTLSLWLARRLTHRLNCHRRALRKTRVRKCPRS